MALSPLNKYSNSIQGIPGSGSAFSVIQSEALPKFPAGYLVERADGCRFRYCHIGTTTNAGVLVGPTTSSGGATYNAVTVVDPTLATAEQFEYPVTPGLRGSHYVEVTAAGIAADKYAGGYLITTRGTGIGNTYRIAGNTATGNPVSGNLHIRLYDEIRVSFTSSVGTIIVPSMYTDLTICATTSPQVTGVLMASTNASDMWAWVCTRGTVGCQEDGTNSPAAGEQVTTSSVTAGAYATLVTNATTALVSSFANPIIGYCRTVASVSAGANRQGAIYLEIE